MLDDWMITFEQSLNLNIAYSVYLVKTVRVQIQKYSRGWKQGWLIAIINDWAMYN